MLDRFFLDHPRRVGESYGAHLVASSRFGLRMIGGGLACIVHAIVPALCVKTGSTAVRQLHRDMQPRSEQAQPAVEPVRYLPEYEI